MFVKSRESLHSRPPTGKDSAWGCSVRDAVLGRRDCLGPPVVFSSLLSQAVSAGNAKVKETGK